MEYVKIMFSSTRPVNVDGSESGDTNAVLLVDAGTHQFDLGTPADYYPGSQNVAVTGTSSLGPKIVVFTKRKV